MKHGRIPFVEPCRSFISAYVPSAGLPGAMASVFPIPHGLGGSQIRQYT